MRFLFNLYFFLSVLVTFSQELPPVVNFDPNQYEGGNQNWEISQSHNKKLYFANSSGLLEYTGAEWNLYPVPNNTVVRSVNVAGDLIFTGAYMEVGYWKKNKFGSLEYTSLLPAFPSPVKDGEQFWHMESVGDVVVIQSFEGLYLYNLKEDELKKIETSQVHPVTNLFKSNNNIYFQVAEEGLFLMKNGKAEKIIGTELLGNLELMHVFERQGTLQLISQKAEIFKLENGQLEPVNLKLNALEKNLSIFSAIDLPNGEIILGTVEDGIYHLNATGEIVNHFNLQNGLLNNTVLSLFLDEDKNVWAGLDNGISVINLYSPFRLFLDNYGKVGSVYTSFQKEDYLYLGTNQGLYYRKNGNAEFNLIEGTNGQVWSLQEIDGILFCGHNKGTFIINETEAFKIAYRFGTWIVKPYRPNPEYLIQGHYNGISFLHKTGNTFEELPMLEGFPHSSKFITSEEDGDVWIGNEHKGVFRLRLNDSLNAITEIENFPFNEVSGINSGMFRFNDTLYFSTTTSIFQYLEDKNMFTQENALAQLLEPFTRLSGRIISDGNDRIWGFTKNSIFSVEVSQLSGRYKVNTTYLPGDLRNIALGYENLTRLSANHYLLGVANGYVVFDRSGSGDGNNEIRIDKITKSALDEDAALVNLGGENSFEHRTNNINFQFSIPEYSKFLTPVYSYRLVGMSPQWTEWREEASASFKNLSYGEYDFQVRGKVGDEITDVVSYQFTIKRPWYLSNIAIAGYILLFLVLIFIVHKLYERQHRKIAEKNEKELRMKHLEAEQKIIKLQNEQLERDMANKNKELAVSTMSLIKKNEFLTSIKEKLKVSSESTEVKSVIRTIDKDISEEDNWKFFKEAFSNADKDFFQKIKARHPQLTSNDLKLCAYLRLNLSSKEIAPLLNISVKSVEIKRYRLRKKMDLPRERPLTDYILEI